MKTWAALQTMVKGAVSGIGMHGMADGGVGGNGMHGMANGEVGGVGRNGRGVGGMRNKVSHQPSAWTSRPPRPTPPRVLSYCRRWAPGGIRRRASPRAGSSSDVLVIAGMVNSARIAIASTHGAIYANERIGVACGRSNVELRLCRLVTWPDTPRGLTVRTAFAATEAAVVAAETTSTSVDEEEEEEEAEEKEEEKQCKRKRSIMKYAICISGSSDGRSRLSRGVAVAVF